MRHQVVLLALSAATLSGGAATAATVEVRDAVARVTVAPSNRTDVRVEIIDPNNRLPLAVRTLPGGRTIIDGDLDRKIRSCRGEAGRAVVSVRDVGEVSWSDMPRVVIHTPRDVEIETGGAVFGSVGRSSSLKLSNAGCGDWVVANVEGEAKVNQAGSGDTRMGGAGSLKVRVSGSGDLAAGDVRNGLDVNIAGSGSAAVRSASGPVGIHIAGSGDVEIGAGRAAAMTVSIAGSGDVNFRGGADSLHARIAGSGGIRAREVRGEVSKTIIGSGSVSVGK